MVGKKVTESIPGIRESDPKMFEIYGRVARTGRPESFEMFVEALKMWFAIAVYCPAPDHFVAVFDVITARKRAEEQTRSAKEDWERTFDAVPDLICILDTKHTIRRANRAMAAKLGVTTEQAVGLTCYQCVHGLQSPPDSCPHTKMLLDLQEHTIEVHEDRLGGDYLVTCTPLFDKAGQLLGSVHVARDITASKQAAILSNQLAAIVQSSDDAIVGKDLHGMITSWNSGAEKMFGYTALEMVGCSILRLIPIERQVEEQGILQRVMQGQTVQHFETVRQAKDGRCFDVSVTVSPIKDAAGQIVGCSKVARDITARKQVEDQLRQNTLELQEAQRVAQIGSWEWDIPTDVIRWSPELYHIFSFDPAVSLPNYIQHLELYTAESNERLHAAVEEAIRTGVGYDLDLKLVQARPENATTWVHVRGEARRDAGGKIIGLRGTTQDITARKQAEELLLESNERLDRTLTELRQTQRQIVAQENLRVLGQMASGIAHDFNNALSPIVGFSELLLKHPEKLADHEHVLERLQIINTCANDAAQVVRQMREFSRPHTSHDVFRPFDLNKLVRQTIDLTQQRWKDQAQASGQTIHVVTNLLPVLPITGEESALRELLTNLIFNAVDAMPAGGTITLGTMLDGPAVRLSVSDTGVGMTEEVRRRCSEPFFTTKGPEELGLGLAMVLGIVQRHNGTVEIASQVGQGTTFIVRLPIQPSVKPMAVPPEIPALPRVLHVLVVDDEPMLCAVTKAWLIEDGHTVETFATGAAALARLATAKFDLVITDKAMPAMNGEQLAAAIHQRVPGLPVILMTGFGDLIKITGVMPPHISAILSKPLTQASLRETLAKALPEQR